MKSAALPSAEKFALISYTELKNKKRNRIIGLSMILFIILVLYFKPFSRTEIIILDHLTKINNGVEHQICLVKNPPYSSETLIEKIDTFNLSQPVKGKYYSRLFIKEHDYIWFPALSLQENIDYQSLEISSTDLNNIDFLADSYFFKSVSGNEYKSTQCRVGELWYYKN